MTTKIAMDTMAASLLERYCDQNEELVMQGMVGALGLEDFASDREKLSAALEKNAAARAAGLSKQGSIGSFIAGKAIKGGVGKAGGLGALLGGLAGGARRAYQINKASKMTPAALAKLVGKGSTAAQAHAASGGRIMTAAHANDVRAAEMAKKLIRKGPAGRAGASVAEGAKGTVKGQIEKWRGFAPDVLRSAASGAASGGATGAGGRLAYNALKRKRMAQKIDAAAPWVAGGAGTALLMRDRG